MDETVMKKGYYDDKECVLGLHITVKLKTAEE